MTDAAGRAPLGSVLAPLRARYTQWLGLDDEGLQADLARSEESPRAMQLILRLERSAPPSWHAAVGAAATGCAALCLDPRAEPGGPWHQQVGDYCAGRIRKVTRRARATQWGAVGDLQGVYVRVPPTTGSDDTERGGDVHGSDGSDGSDGSCGTADTDGTGTAPGRDLIPARAELRVLVPEPMAGLDKRVSRLQVGGTDVPVDAPSPPQPGVCLVVHVPTEPAMTLGKTMAQAGHAGMIAAALLAGDDPGLLSDWLGHGLRVRVARCGPGEWRPLLRRAADPAVAWSAGRLVAVRDAGFTEIAPGTITAIATMRDGR